MILSSIIHVNMKLIGNEGETISTLLLTVISDFFVDCEFLHPYGRKKSARVALQTTRAYKSERQHIMLDEQYGSWRIAHVRVAMTSARICDGEFTAVLKL